MGICDYDYGRLFEDKAWEGDWIDHHNDAALWAEAVVHDACPICTVLWQKLHGGFENGHDDLPINTEAREQYIIAALAAFELPFFRVQLRELASDEFLLNFSARNRNSTPQIADVNFYIYPPDGKYTGALIPGPRPDPLTVVANRG
jgi:hypothetical protein